MQLRSCELTCFAAGRSGLLHVDDRVAKQDKWASQARTGSRMLVAAIRATLEADSALEDNWLWVW